MIWIARMCKRDPRLMHLQGDRFSLRGIPSKVFNSDLMQIIEDKRNFLRVTGTEPAAENW